MGFEQKDDLFSSDDIGFEVDDEINLEDGELTGLHAVKAPKRSARERIEVKQGVRRDRLGRPDGDDGDGDGDDLVAPVKGVRLSGNGAASMHTFSGPMLSESSEFGYLFSDDEPDDSHMNEENASRLAALAYDERQDGDGEQYEDIFKKSDEPMVRRKSFRKHATATPARQVGQSEQAGLEKPPASDSGGKSSRFSRRSREEAVPARSEEPTTQTGETYGPSQNMMPEQDVPPPDAMMYDASAQGGQPYPDPQQMYGYPQYPAQYPQYPMPYPPYPQYPYPQMGYPQAPYPPYMPMPYSPPVVVVPSMGYYYDPYDEEGGAEPFPYPRRRRRPPPPDADLSGHYEDSPPQPEKHAVTAEQTPAPMAKDFPPEPVVQPPLIQDSSKTAEPEPEPEPERYDTIEDAPPAPRFKRRGSAETLPVTPQSAAESVSPSIDEGQSDDLSQPAVLSRFNRRANTSAAQSPVDAPSNNDDAPSPAPSSRFRRRGS